MQHPQKIDFCTTRDFRSANNNCSRSAGVMSGMHVEVHEMRNLTSFTETIHNHNQPNFFARCNRNPVALRRKKSDERIAGRTRLGKKISGPVRSNCKQSSTLSLWEFECKGNLISFPGLEANFFGFSFCRSKNYGPKKLWITANYLCPQISLQFPANKYFSRYMSSTNSGVERWEWTESPRIICSSK